MSNTRDLQVMTYADGEMSDDERQAFEQDIEADETLRDAVDRYDRLRSDVRNAALLIDNSPMSDSLCHTIQRLQTKPRRNVLPVYLRLSFVPDWLLRPLPVFASAVIALGVVSWSLSLERRPDLTVSGIDLREPAQTFADGESGAGFALIASYGSFDGRACRLVEITQPPLTEVAVCRANARSPWTLAAKETHQEGFETAGSTDDAASIAAVLEDLERMDAWPVHKAKDKRANGQ